MSSSFKVSDRGSVEPTVDWMSLPLLASSPRRSRKRSSAILYFAAGLTVATLIGAIF